MNPLKSQVRNSVRRRLEKELTTNENYERLMQQAEEYIRLFPIIIEGEYYQDNFISDYKKRITEKFSI